MGIHRKLQIVKLEGIGVHIQLAAYLVLHPACTHMPGATGQSQRTDPDHILGDPGYLSVLTQGISIVHILKM